MAVKLRNAEGQELILPLSVSWPSYARSMAVPTVRLAGDGAVVAAPVTREPFAIQLAGSIWDPDPDAARQQADQLETLLAYPPIEVYADAASDRHAVAYPSGVSVQRLALGREYQVSIDLQVPDPYLYGAERTHSQSAMASPTDYTVDAGGALPTIPEAVITLAAACNDPVLTNLSTGQSVGASGSFAAGDVLRWDNRQMVLYRNGVAAMDRTTDDWLVKGFTLRAGVNSLRFTASGAVNATIQLTWRPRY